MLQQRRVPLGWLVEVAGIEPASEKICAQVSTCVFRVLISEAGLPQNGSSVSYPPFVSPSGRATAPVSYPTLSTPDGSPWERKPADASLTRLGRNQIRQLCVDCTTDEVSKLFSQYSWSAWNALAISVTIRCDVVLNHML